jgi:hypothetical protein
VQAADEQTAGPTPAPAAGADAPVPPKDGEAKTTDAKTTDAKTTDVKTPATDTPNAGTTAAPAAGYESRGSRRRGEGRGGGRDSGREGRTADTKAPAADAQNAAPATGWARYQVLTERNMFLKNRAKPRVFEAKQEEMGPPAPKVETDVVLSGIVEKDGQLAAFLENSRSGTVRLVRKDDEVGGGKIGAITISGIEYISNGATRTVTVGMTLEGGSIANLGTAKTGSGSSDTDSVLERLRKKRQEEMNK